jgi:hypothetical protein
MFLSDLPAVYAAVVLHQGPQLGHDPNASVFPWTHERAMLSVNESISVHQSDTHEAASPRPNPSSRKWVPHYEEWRARALVHRSEGFHCQHTIRESGGDRIATCLSGLTGCILLVLRKILSGAGGTIAGNGCPGLINLK